MKTDFHMHSRFSHDSKASVEEMTAAAIRKGVNAICFTEHTDYGAPGDNDFDHDGLRRAVDEMNSAHSGRISVGFGAEIGVQLESLDRAEMLVNRHDFDFVIMSCHRIGGKSFRQQFYQQGKTQVEYNRGYYGSLLECARLFKGYNVIGHLNVISRYDACGPLPFDHVRDIIEEIYRVIIPAGKGIEINTSSIRHGMDVHMPSAEMLKLYKSMGGEVITVGSDAHCPEHVTGHFDEALELLKSTGFRYICTFRDKKPIWHSI